jgi:hypothetical protein
VQKDNEPSTLDYVFYNEDDLFQEDIQYEAPLGKSDHLVLTWKSHTVVPEASGRQRKLNYWKGNYAAINDALSAVRWEEEMVGLSVEDKWRLFKNTLTRFTNEFIPIQGGSKRKKNQWISRQP